MLDDAPDALTYATTSLWARASLVAALFAVDPIGLGGISLRAGAGPVREHWLQLMRSLMAPATLRRVPVQVSDDRLLGGLDLAATLQAGKPIAERGILAAANGEVLLLTMAERLPSDVAARIAAVLDTHEVVVERDGMTSRTISRFGVIALDEGIAADERPPLALLERLAFHIDVNELALRDIADPLYDAGNVAMARMQLSKIHTSDEIIESLCATAQALGVDSLRVALLALRAARAAAALAQRLEVTAEDAGLAGALVLSSRATRVPKMESQATQDDSEVTPHEETTQPQDASNLENNAEQQQEVLDDQVLAATQAAMPAGLLAQLNALESKSSAHSIGKAGAVRRSALRGRPIGVCKGAPRAGVRLNLLATLRAAAPWQKLRRASAAATHQNRPRVLVSPEDFHITRYQQRSETTTIFMLDASGSSALHRLAEAKGAVELLLADCYVRRDQVAVIAFRNRQADMLLPPTRSLVRAKRSLAALPGGGGTPLANGIDAGMAVAESVRRRGATPTLVLLTDGRANIARDGSASKALAQQQALLSARRVRAAGIRALLIDTSPRPQDLGRTLATELGARYLPLPYADASALASAVQAAATS